MVSELNCGLSSPTNLISDCCSVLVKATLWFSRPTWAIRRVAPVSRQAAIAFSSWVNRFPPLREAVDDLDVPVGNGFFDPTPLNGHLSVLQIGLDRPKVGDHRLHGLSD